MKWIPAFAGMTDNFNIVTKNPMKKSQHKSNKFHDWAREKGLFHCPPK